MKNALATRIGENPKLVTHVIAVKTVVKPSARSTMNPSKILTVKRVNIARIEVLFSYMENSRVLSNSNIAITF